VNAVDGPERTSLQHAQRALLAVLGVLLLALIASGLWLVFRYRPSGSFRGAHPESTFRSVHRFSSGVFLLTALVTFGVSIAVAVEGRLRRGLPAWVPALLLLVGAVPAGISGYLLTWDQLALWAVTVGTDMRGYGYLFDGHTPVRFVLLGGSEVGIETMRRWFVAHTIGFPVGLVVVGVVLARVTRRARVAEAPTA
jgi:quinol-cytochrome oxidoreductase complex cytochrome b subunit